MATDKVAKVGLIHCVKLLPMTKRLRRFRLSSSVYLTKRKARNTERN